MASEVINLSRMDKSPKAPSTPTPIHNSLTPSQLKQSRLSILPPFNSQCERALIKRTSKTINGHFVSSMIELGESACWKGQNHGGGGYGWDGGCLRGIHPPTPSPFIEPPSHPTTLTSPSEIPLLLWSDSAIVSPGGRRFNHDPFVRAHSQKSDWYREEGRKAWNAHNPYSLTSARAVRALPMRKSRHKLPLAKHCVWKGQKMLI